MKKNNLIVSEVFYSIQGEGPTMGVPSVFLRLAGCNLLCSSKHWVCDSIEVWQKGRATDFEDVLEEDYLEKLKNGAHLVVTGGEPMLQQQRVVEFLEWVHTWHGFWPYVEVETNGTIKPCTDLLAYVGQWNCSPKLGNSGEPYEKRVNNIAIQELNKRNTFFKFVVSERDDFLDILQDYGELIDMKKVVLMPAGDSREKLNETRPEVIELCKTTGLRYCDRLQIVNWNKTTGV